MEAALCWVNGLYFIFNMIFTTVRQGVSVINILANPGMVGDVYDHDIEICQVTEVR